MRIAVIITFHNRKENTLRCLDSMAAAMNHLKGMSGYEQWQCDVFLNDDGSSDGTDGAIEKWKSEIRSSVLNVHISQGTGNDYWAKGMEMAWRAAEEFGLREGIEFDYFLWLNDDVVLRPNAIHSMLCMPKGKVIVGECCDPSCPTAKTYGIDGKWFNGNIVLVPKDIYEKVGMIDGAYAHSKADYDYAERVRRAGFDIMGTEGFAGECEADWKKRYMGKTVIMRLHMMFEPCYWNLHDLWRFRMKYYGSLRAIASCMRLVWIVVKGV